MPQVGHAAQLQTMSPWSHMAQPAQVIHQQSSSSGSSSDSDSESSSGSSSSDSSDDSSDQENDKEVVRIKYSGLVLASHILLTSSPAFSLVDHGQIFLFELRNLFGRD